MGRPETGCPAGLFLCLWFSVSPIVIPSKEATNNRVRIEGSAFD
jgi:hypothetical protein